jgi:uncharacterized protein (TIGR00255 family)
MIRSMTGYSQAQVLEGGATVSVGIKSINHRFLDQQVRLPSALVALEPAVRRLIKEYVIRGHVEVTVGVEHLGGPSIQFNRPLLQASITAWRELAKEFGVHSEPEMGSLLALPGMVSVENGKWSEEDVARLSPLIEKAAARALEQLNEMRASEGASLESDLRRRLGRLRALAEEVNRLSSRVSEIIRQRLERRIQEIAATVGLDLARLAQEVAYLASRSDISEELTRLVSHLDQADHLLEVGLEVGKKLDFLLQEMNREANTLLSKTTDVPEVGTEVSRLGIEMKNEIEKLREQAQNIE